MKKLLTSVLSILFLLVFLTCNDNGGGGGGGGEVSRETIGPEGGEITSADGRLTLTFPPGALAEDIEIIIVEDSTESPDSIGKRYNIDPSGFIFREPVTVVFNFDDIELGNEGTTNLAIAFFGNEIPIPLTGMVDEGAKTITTQVTHLTTFGLVRSKPLSTRDEVAELIKNAFVPALWSPIVIVTGPMEPLQAGDTVSESVGRSFFPTDILEAPALLPPTRHTVEKETWFFWVDLLPTAFYRHDGIFLYIDPETGTFLEEKAYWWPLINGEEFLRDVVERFNSEETVYNASDHLGAEIIPPITAEQLKNTDSRTDINLDRLSGTVFPQEESPCAEGSGVLIIQGSDDLSGFSASAVAVENYMISSVGANFSETEVQRVKVSGKTAFIKALEPYQGKGSCFNEFVLYIDTHGDDVGLHFAGPPHSGEDPEDPDKFILWPQLLTEINKIKADKFTLVLESCESGALVNYIQKTRDDTFRFLGKPLDPFFAQLVAPALDANVNIIFSAKEGRSGFQGFIGLGALLTGQTEPLNFTDEWLQELMDLPDKRDWAGAADAVIKKSQGPIDTLLNPLLSYSSPGQEHFLSIPFDVELPEPTPQPSPGPEPSPTPPIPSPTPSPKPALCLVYGFYASESFGCGIVSFGLIIQQDGDLTLTGFAGNPGEIIFNKTNDPKVFQSESSDLVIFNQQGHRCTITCGPEFNQVTLKCTRQDGAMCTEVFTLQ